ncbi:MAG: DHA2 family efflux MFS transporter permease subunit [Proteobacteria bacterium]|nr:DHA2 family efflux MFS transporter permease subunit [Pseudomonadota bacterium]
MASAAAAVGGHTPVANKALVTVAVMLATAMQALDTTIANVALPNMQSSLGAATDTITWVLTSYIIAAAIMTPVTGWLADRLGRKRLFLIAVGGFVVASMLCGTAISLDEMVIFRTLQGVFGAALVPLSQSVLLDINPREKHGQAMAIWGAGIMVAPIIGPTLGGWLTDSMSWRWVFYINLPVGLLAFAGMLLFLPETEVRRRKFDLFGFGLFAVAVGAFQLMLDRGENLDWFASPEIMVEAALAAVAAYMFVVHSFTTREPFIRPHLFADRNFAVGMVLIFGVGVILLATMALLPPMMQTLYGYPIMTTGMVLAPRGMGTMAAMLVLGRLGGRVDGRALIFTGLGLTVFSLWQMTGFSPQMGVAPFITSGVVQGLGLGFIFGSLSVMAFGTLPQKMRTDGTGLYNLVRNLGSSVGVSVVATLLAQNTQIVHAQLAARLTPYNPQLAMAKGLDLATPQGLAALNGMVTAQAQMVAYLDDFKLMMLMTVVLMPLVFLLKAPAKAAKGHAVPAVD